MSKSLLIQLALMGGTVALLSNAVETFYELPDGVVTLFLYAAFFYWYYARPPASTKELLLKRLLPAIGAWLGFTVLIYLKYQ